MTTLFVTAPRDDGEDLARTLVEEDLVACVNLVQCRSFYQWNDELQNDAEVILFIKTTSEAYQPVKDRIVELHPYDVPCIERFEEQDILTTYTQWVEQQVTAVD